MFLNTSRQTGAYPGDRMIIHPDAGLRRSFLLVAVAVLSHGCTGNTTGIKEVPPCDPPTAVNGEDQSVALGALATLDGSGSTDCDQDKDGVPELTYAWSFVSVPAGSALSNDNFTIGEDPAKGSFQPDVTGTYVVELVVTDAEDQQSAPDLMLVTVTSDNGKPVADCGGNLTGVSEQRLDLDGSKSSDPEGDALEYNWTLSSSPSCSALTSSSIYNGKTPTAAVVPDCAGVYVVGLVVSDGESWSDPAFCTISVAGLDQTPVADAGQSTVMSPCAPSTATLNGFGSYDPEGLALTYRWAVVSVPNKSNVTDASISDPTLANPTFRWDVPGDYSFQLQVSDGTHWSAPDVVVLTFQDKRDNNPPQANAGDDVTINTTTECTTAHYVFTCDDCPDETVEVDGSASIDDKDGDDLSFLWTEATGEAVIASPASPVTEVAVPGFPSVYNTATVRSWELALTVADCADEDTDRVTISYSCKGEYSP